MFGSFGGVGARGAGGDDGEGYACVSVGLYALFAFFRGADDGEGAEHGVGDEGLEVRAAFAFQEGLADGGGLVGEAVLGKGTVVAGEETGVETRSLADALEVGGAVGGDDGGYEVGDGDFLAGSRPAARAPSATVAAAFSAPDRVVQVRIVPSVISPQVRSILSNTAAA